MTKNLRLFPLVLLVSFLCTIGMKAQTPPNDIAAQLGKIAQNNLSGYVEPLVSGFGASMNSGIYHSADLHSILGFDIGVKVGVTMLKDENKSFVFNMPVQLSFGGQTLLAGRDYDQTIVTPTVVGNANGLDIKLKSSSPLYALLGNQTIFTTPKGFDFTFPGAPISGVPAGALQASIGLPLGFEVIGRFIPTVNAGDAGKFGLTGFGLRHDIDQYIPFMPIDIAIHFMSQKLTMNDKSDKKVLSASATAYGIEVSKGLLFLTLYGGYQIESSKIEFESYQYKPDAATTITIPPQSFDGAKKNRLHAGVRFLLLFLNVHADYAFSSTYPVATIGAGITFR